MIRRIQEIVGVGPFENFTNGGQYQFESLTLIFGLNTYGKSTLADIFRSLRDDNIEIVEKRQTIGMINQRIKIKYSLCENQGELDLFFRNNRWDNRDNFPFKIEVFDAKFIEKNVSTGLSITRDNKENLTDFILGEEGVNLANEIKDSKKKRSDLHSQMEIEKESGAEKIKDYSIEWEKFIDLDVDEKKKENLEEKIKRIKLQIEKINDNKKHINSILNLQEPKAINIELNFSTLFTRFNEILGKGYEELNQEIFNKIATHIDSVFKEKDNKEEEWIRKGFFYIRGEINSKCPFCGRPLNQSELFSLYQRYFSEGYRNFLKETEKSLNEIEKEIKRKYDQLIDNIFNIDDPIRKLQDAENYIDKEDFQKNKKGLSSQINTLKEVLEKYKTELNKLLEVAQNKKTEKFKSPYTSVEPINISNISEIEKNIRDLIKRINAHILKLSKIINKIKDTYKNPSQLESELLNLKEKLKSEELKSLRIELNEKCDNWRKLNDELQKIKKDIEEKEKKLQKTQEDFVNKYFNKVNELFESLGSNKFRIDKKIERKGYKNTVSLEIKYNNKHIPYQDIEFVFSDSDRRALAFSIFLAKLEIEDEGQTKNTIVILDDPVTSFDDNRIRTTISKMQEMSRKVRQLIILSHYRDFFVKLMSSLRDVNYASYKINRTSTGSQFAKIDDDFLLDEHEKMFIKIQKFIDRENSEDITKDLRLFFENEIKIRYRLRIYENNLQNAKLKKLIERLFEYNVIDEEKKEKLHDFREQLNPEHHPNSGNHNEEDIRNFAKSLLKYIYEEL